MPLSTAVQQNSPEGLVYLSADIDAELFNLVEQEAKAQGVSVEEIVSKAVYAKACPGKLVW